MMRRIVTKEVFHPDLVRREPFWIAHLECGHRVEALSWEPPWSWDGSDHPTLLCRTCAASPTGSEGA